MPDGSEYGGGSGLLSSNDTVHETWRDDEDIQVSKDVRVMEYDSAH